jgi:hypothetical protein
MVIEDRYEITNLALDVLPGESDLVSVGMKEYRELLQYPTLKAVYIDSEGNDWTTIFCRLKGAIEQIDISGARSAIVQIGCRNTEKITMMNLNAVLDIVRGNGEPINIQWGTQNGIHLPPEHIYVFVVYGYSAQ